MIASLEGVLRGRTGGAAIISVGGVGYLVHVSSRTLEAMGPIGSEVFVHVETSVRQDAIVLFGFASLDEQELFRLMTAIQGVGPKIGLALLSHLTPDDFARAVLRKDTVALTAANGVGSKLAQRLLTEMATKVDAFIGAGEAVDDARIQVPSAKGLHPEQEDAVEALLGLGYHKHQARQMVEEVLELPKSADFTIEDIIRLALRSAVTR